MATLDLDQLTPLQRLTVERALVLAQQLETTAEAAPHGQVIDRIESLLLGNGRDFLRKTLEDSLQGRVDALEKKGRRRPSARAAKLAATKADPNAQ